MVEKKSSRILTFDLLRGYFLIAIILDHLNFFPNGLDWWSARGDLFVTTAEGFFLISGIVLGIVRGSKLLHEPFRHVSKLLLRRSAQLYITSVLLVLIFTLVGWWFFVDNPGLKAGIIPPTTNIFELLWKTVTLQYLYGWADYLRLYAIFMLVSPLAIWLLRQGKWYILTAISIFVWLLFPDDPKLPGATQELFQPLSWQLIFFSGMTIGFYWNQITAWWQSRPKWWRRIARSGIIAAACLTLLINAFIAFQPSPHMILVDGATVELSYHLYISFFDKEQLPMTRIALFAVWFCAAFILFKKFEPFIMRTMGWLLLSFGTNSLYVYTVHAFVIFFVHIWLQSGNILTNFIVSVGIIALIRIMIHYNVLMKIIPR